MEAPVERELVGPIDLCDTRGRLNPVAHGWLRQPDVRGNLTRAWGRKKKWDYWNVSSNEVVVSFVYADIDYAGLANVWVMELATGDQTTAGILQPFARGFAMPDHVCTGTVAVHRPAFELRIEETEQATRLVARSPKGKGSLRGAIEVDLTVAKPEGHESLNVVVPWSRRRFQFTSKHNTRPATGTVRVGDREWVLDESHDAWGVQDLGRGVWKYSNRWNWASASGHCADGHVVGLQFGGKWTVGTGSTENGVVVDGRMSKISSELEWTYDWDHPMRPWRVRTVDSDRVDVTLTPSFDRYDVTDLKVLRMEVHQCFGTWSGRVVDDLGTEHHLHGIRGFAEEARNRW